MQLDNITFTGIDYSTNLQDITALIEYDSRAEFGVLLSYNNSGNRYPSDASFFNKILTDIPHDNLDIHICGTACANFLSNPYSILPLEFDNCRIQLNIGKWHGIDYAKLATFISDFNLRGLIFQHGKSELAFKLSQYSDKVSVLVDSNGGRGKEITQITEPFNGVKTGYAGGIGPDNIETVLLKLEDSLPKDYTTWVDMETKIRTNDWFDIRKIKLVLEKVKRYESLVD